MRPLAVFPLIAAALAAAPLETRLFRVDTPGNASALWTYTVKPSGEPHRIAPPVFEVDGKVHPAVLVGITAVGSAQTLRNGVKEYRFEGAFRDDPSLSLEIVFRAAEKSPVVRFAYVLKSSGPHRLTKAAGRDALTYLGASLKGLPDSREVRLSEFLEAVHSYSLAERLLETRDFEDKLSEMGPILAASGPSRSFLLAYEHGSQAPNAFLEYKLEPDRFVRLTAVKGNYIDGQPLDPQHPYRTVWMEAAGVNAGLSALRDAYREFALKWLAASGGSRMPYIFYNTWNFQERNKHWYGHAYLDSMNQERMLQEIEVAHRLGIDVFVLDTGWYEKTGDWAVSRKRFPGGLAEIRNKLSGYGMKLGLWFGPTSAGISSKMLRSNRDCVMSWRGKERAPHAIWETEESYDMCLVSRYSDAFADELIRLYKELGVTYFKWDAVDQYGCDSPNHWHGTAGNTPEERAQSYGFQVIQQMTRIVEKVTDACPDAIVDFDITESGRAVGLAYLTAGKFFAINNGPYYQNYDVPINPEKDNWNLFFHKGPARTWITRTLLAYDAWLPSVLFMTHYFPDDPYSSQIVNLGSLILGQNGIWGDLPRISEDGVALFGRMLGYYKQVREDITAAAPVRRGPVSGTGEVHEKISAETGRGVVVVFSTARGSVSYVTSHRAARDFKATEGAEVSFDATGRARLELKFAEPGAHIAFFGVK